MEKEDFKINKSIWVIDECTENFVWIHQKGIKALFSLEIKETLKLFEIMRKMGFSPKFFNLDLGSGNLIFEREKYEK